MSAQMTQSRILRIDEIISGDIDDLLGVGAQVLAVYPSSVFANFLYPNGARVIKFPPGWEVESYTDAEINTTRDLLYPMLFDENGRLRGYIRAENLRTQLTLLGRYATIIEFDPRRIIVADRDCNSCLHVIGTVPASDHDHKLTSALLTAGKAWLDEHIPGWKAYNFGRN